MASLPWGQLITAALVAFVVFASLKAGGGIAEAANKVTSIVGVEIVPLSIKSFAATPDGSGNMQFQISLAGDTSKAELAIYQKYEPNLYNDISAPDLKEDAVYKLIASDSPPGATLVNVAPNGVVKQTCPQDATVVGENGCESLSSYKPGGYRFVAVLKKKGKVVDSMDALTGIYTKEGIELLDKPVKDCPDCNVKECKRKVVRNSLAPKNPGECRYGVKVIYGRAYNELYPQISGPVIRSPEFASCQYPPSELPINAEDAFKLCPAEEINKLYQKAASWVFFDSACEEVGMADETVDEVNKLFNTDKMGAIQRITQQKLSDCVRKAEEAFTERGWALFLTEQDRKDYNIYGNVAYTATDMARVDAWSGFDKYIRNELPPIIRNLKATLTPDNKIKVSWDLPVGSDNVKNVGLAYMYRSFVSSSGTFTSIPTVVPLNKASRSYTLTPKELIGQHRFTVTAESTNPVADSEKFPELEGTVQVDAEQAGIGFYNNEYIELYRDSTGVCKDCNVADKKEAALGDNQFGWSNLPGKTRKPEETYVYVARCGDSVPRFKGSVTDCGDNGGKFTVSCQLDKSKGEGEKRITGCSEKEVDVLYRAVAEAYASDKGLPAGKTAADLLKIDCKKEESWIGSDIMYKDTKIKDVCNAKDSLRNELEKAKWVYLGG